MKEFLNHFFLYFVAVTVLSCQNPSNDNTYNNQKTFKADTLMIPQALQLYNHPRGSHSMDSLIIANADKKLYISIDASCASCFDKVNFWTSVADDLIASNVIPIIILRSKDQFRLFKMLCKNQKIMITTIPFFFDYDIAFERINNLGDTQVYTDRQNKIIKTLHITDTNQVVEFVQNLKP